MNLLFKVRVFLYYVRLEFRLFFWRPQRIFTDIYKRNAWGGNESVSGRGSDMDYTKFLRNDLSVFLDNYNIQSMLDIPCGDYNWMQHVRKKNVFYIGADIVEELIKENKRKYEMERVSFKHLNLISDPLPQVDLIFCRDCFIHLSDKHVMSCLRNIKKSGSKYLLLSTAPDRDHNFSIQTGKCRHLNLEKPPFSLPPPILLILKRIPRRLCLGVVHLTKSIQNLMTKHHFDSLDYGR